MSKNPLPKLASFGEDVIGKAAQNPATNRLLQTGLQLRDRVDDLSKRVRGLEAMENRLEELEVRVEKLEHRGASTKATASKPAGAKKTESQG